MNLTYLGDSYDVVKRLWCNVASSLGYATYVDPMFTGAWVRALRTTYFRFLGARPIPAKIPAPPAALLIDPDTGIQSDPGAAHTTFEAVAQRCRQFSLVIVFDQSFARGPDVRGHLIRKLRVLRELDVRGLYYDSHARFLICSSAPGPPMRFRKALVKLGLPPERFVGLPPAERVSAVKRG